MPKQNPLHHQISRRAALAGLGGAAALAAGAGGGFSARAAGAPLDLNTSADNLTAFLKMRADLSGKTIGHYWAGNVHAMLPGEKDVHVFTFEGFAFSRLEKFEAGYRMIHRELGYYRDAKTGKILETWLNPFTGKEVEVLPVLNDPVNANFQPEGPRGPFMVPHQELSGDVWFSFDAMLNYPSPLPRKDWPEASQNDTYEAAELFTFHCKRADLDNPDLTGVQNNVTWTRIGPWLPWMLNADRPGQLVYHTRGKKIAGPEELPEETRKYTEAKYAKYLSAPDAWAEPNETSWTYYKKVMEGRKAQP